MLGKGRGHSVAEPRQHRNGLVFSGLSHSKSLGCLHADKSKCLLQVHLERAKLGWQGRVIPWQKWDETRQPSTACNRPRRPSRQRAGIPPSSSTAPPPLPLAPRVGPHLTRNLTDLQSDSKFVNPHQCRGCATEVRCAGLAWLHCQRCRESSHHWHFCKSNYASRH